MFFREVFVYFIGKSKTFILINDLIRNYLLILSLTNRENIKQHETNYFKYCRCSIGF